MNDATRAALTRPLFDTSAFAPTKWDSAEDKARFAKALCRFMACDFRKTMFTDTLYRRLSNCFGHIAHTNRHGFLAEFFESAAGKIDFLQLTLQWPCYGDPAYTFSDVERVIQVRIKMANLLTLYRWQQAAEQEAAERAQLRRLLAKYGGAPLPPEPQPVTPPIRLPARPKRPARQEMSQPTLF